MASKKRKKSRQQAIQRKRQQRRRARIGRRSISTDRPVEQLSGLSNPRFIEDIAPLFPEFATGLGLPNDAMERLLKAAWSTYDLLDQPEFANIELSPLDVMQTYVEISEDQGILPDQIQSQSVDSQMDRMADVFDLTVERMLTAELIGQFRHAFTSLRQRLRRHRNVADLARVAAAEMFLNEGESSAVASGIGAIRQLVRLNLELGLDLAQELFTESKPDDSAEPTPDSMLQRVRNSGVTKKLDNLFSKIPGVRSFTEKKVQEVQKAGDHAVFTGEIVLNVYSPLELRHAQKILRSFLPEDADDSDAMMTAFVEEHGKALIEGWIAYIHELFTPERVEQVYQVLERATHNPAYAETQWAGYLLLLREIFREADAPEYAGSFLFSALMFELRQMEIDENKVEGKSA